MNSSSHPNPKLRQFLRDAAVATVAGGLLAGTHLLGIDAALTGPNPDQPAVPSTTVVAPNVVAPNQNAPVVIAPVVIVPVVVMPGTVEATPPITTTATPKTQELAPNTASPRAPRRGRCRHSASAR